MTDTKRKDVLEPEPLPCDCLMPPSYDPCDCHNSGDLYSQAWAIGRNQMRETLATEIRALREGLRKSLRLPELLLKSEEQSSSHSHGPRRAAEYDRKYRALFDEICALLPDSEDDS